MGGLPTIDEDNEAKSYLEDANRAINLIKFRYYGYNVEGMLDFSLFWKHFFTVGHLSSGVLHKRWLRPDVHHVTCIHVNRLIDR